MDNYTGKSENGQEWLIRNGRTKEECYLRMIRKERKSSWAEDPVGSLQIQKKKKASRRSEVLPEETAPGLCAVATWTMDETQAMYFRSEAEALALIEQWPVLKKAKARPVQG